MSEGFISRGFRGRRKPSDQSGRLPPGQYLERGFPVLSAGPTPHTPLANWDFSIIGEVDHPKRWRWEEFRALPRETVTKDIHYAFLFLIAAWAILTGILELVAPLAFPMTFWRGLVFVLSGLVSIVFGVLIAAQPAAGLLAVVWLIGVYAIVFGIMHIVVYFESRSVVSSLAGQQR